MNDLPGLPGAKLAADGFTIEPYHPNAPRKGKTMTDPQPKPLSNTLLDAAQAHQTDKENAEEIVNLGVDLLEATIAITWMLESGLARMVGYYRDAGLWNVDVVIMHKGKEEPKRFTGPTLTDTIILAGNHIHEQLVSLHKRSGNLGQYMHWKKERHRLLEKRHTKVVLPWNN